MYVQSVVDIIVTRAYDRIDLRTVVDSVYFC